MPNEAVRGYSGLPNPESSSADGVGGRESRSPDIGDEGCRPVVRIRSSPLGLAPAFAEPVPRKVQILERAETMGDLLTRLTVARKRYDKSNGPCNVVLLRFGMLFPG